MKILISAYSCEPGRGSEPGVGWNVAKEVAKYHQVWVLTRPDESKAIIEAELARHPIPNLNFVYFTLPFWQNSLRWGQSGAIQIHYYLWQIQAYFVARKLHQHLHFDLTHHVTFVKYSNPSFLSLLPIPFIWGPVGGGESAPKAFWQDFSLRAKVYEISRNFMRWLGEIDPFVKITATKSCLVRATTEDTAKRLQYLGVKNIQVISESGLPKQEIISLGKYPIPNERVTKFMSMGRLLHWKGFHLGIRAFATANLPNSEYWILGDGPERQRLEKLAIELGVRTKVKFWGRLPRSQSLEKLKECIALIHPSLHDSGGWVCLEAMAAGRPVICLDLGGPGVQVTSETGFKIIANTPEQTVQDLAVAITRLGYEPQLRLEMGQAAKNRVRELFDQEKMGRNLARLYQQIVEQYHQKMQLENTGCRIQNTK
ncbi:glycosyltransferase family 4 protein [Calothrix sp. NIES-3974]|uniref:glycosyltransferase family 4 protein n=1 Tax=Calothrix sp. NIES-3974 TaxID=2005462 RepID=UPI000B5FC228|nr:glycosyltransferase [Calothrix sp. NIES-3974]BAZ06803.1 group 1 glycosyl transferase [Calothrix sp. NIES-3974]